MKISDKNFLGMIDKIVKMGYEPRYYSYFEIFINRKPYAVTFTEQEVYLEFDKPSLTTYTP